MPVRQRELVPERQRLALLCFPLIAPGGFTPIFFDFEIKVCQIRKQAEEETPKHAYSSPLRWTDLIEQLEQPESGIPG